jgi:hypothetical protein
MSPDAHDRSPHAPAEGNALHVVYPGCSGARLYTAALSAASELGFVVPHRDDATSTFAFHSRAPVRSWPTDQMSAVIRPRGDGARIAIGAERLTGYRLRMADWHQANAIGLMLLDRLKSVLPRISRARGAAAHSRARAARPSPRSTADELATLHELRDRGFLTADEYAAEKQRLLS